MNKENTLKSFKLREFEVQSSIIGGSCNAGALPICFERLTVREAFITAKESNDQDIFCKLKFTQFAMRK